MTNVRGRIADHGLREAIPESVIYGNGEYGLYQIGKSFSSPYRSLSVTMWNMAVSLGITKEAWLFFIINRKGFHFNVLCVYELYYSLRSVINDPILLKI